MSCGVCFGVSSQVGQTPKNGAHTDTDSRTTAKNGFSLPHQSLPPVESILGKAGASAAIAAQAELVHQSLVGKQKETEEALLEKRKVYEQRLADQADRNRKINLANDQLRHSASQAKNANRVTARNIQQIHKGNELLRSAAALLEGKMSGAVEFLQDVLHSTDNSMLMKLVSDPGSLQFEKVPTEHGHRNMDLTKLLSGSHSGGPTVLLQSSASRVTAFETTDNVPNSGLIIQRLADSLNMLAAAAAEGEKNLNARFTRIAEESEQQHHELLVQWTALNQTLSHEYGVKKGLQEAEDRVLLTRRILNQRLHGLRVFVRRIDALVDETTQQAASMGQIDDVDIVTDDDSNKEVSVKINGSDQHATQLVVSPLSKAVAEATKEAKAAKEAADKATDAQIAADIQVDTKASGQKPGASSMFVKMHRPDKEDASLFGSKAHGSASFSEQAGAMASWFSFR